MYTIIKENGWYYIINPKGNKVRRKDLTFVKSQAYWKVISFCQYFGLIPFRFK